jgi:hypothetical protein
VTASLPLNASEENIEGWKSVHLDPNEAGSALLLNTLENFGLTFINTAKIDYPESFPPLFDAKKKEMVAHANSDAVVMTMAKFKQENLRAYGDRIDVRGFFVNHPSNPNPNWDNFEELIHIPTKFVLSNESACQGLDVSMLFAVYDGFGKLGPTKRNPE